ncbi:MAG: ribokinase [Spirochaetaceae bacterium]|nr:ribokinase [Spirochaetaceae bacterium]
MKILNFGSLNIDYVYEVDHFVHAGETESSTKREIFPGGKGLNQSVALSRSGSAVYHAGGIGKVEGIFLKDLLKDNNVNTDFVREMDGPTGHAIIQVNSKGNNCILLYGGANVQQDKPFIDDVFEKFYEGDYLVLQNEINNLKYIVECAHKKNMTIFLNPSPFNSGITDLNLDYIDCFLLNEIEAASMCGSESKDIDELIQMLREKLPSAKFVLTLGKDGVCYFDDKKIYKHEIYDVDVVDTTAAGDTFSGYFISSISKNLGIEAALKIASIASSIAVSKSGAAVSIPLLNEVENSNLRIFK